MSLASIEYHQFINCFYITCFYILTVTSLNLTEYLHFQLCHMEILLFKRKATLK